MDGRSCATLISAIECVKTPARFTPRWMARSVLHHTARCGALAALLATFALFITLTLSPDEHYDVIIDSETNETERRSKFWAYETWGRVRGSGYCEPLREDGAVQEPINSWSNYAYTVVGAATIFLSARDAEALRGGQCRVDELKAHPWFGILMGLTWCALGLSSFLFHAAHVTLFWILDVGFTNSAAAAMLAWAILALALATIPLCAGHPTACTGTMAAALIMLEALLIAYKRNTSATVVLSTLIGLIIALELAVYPSLVGKSRRQLTLTGGAILLMLAAFLVRQAEADRSWGQPLCLFSVWFQPHAVWHTLSAFAIACQVASWRSPYPPPRRGAHGLHHLTAFKPKGSTATMPTLRGESSSSSNGADDGYP
jgi:hypothetical protein